MPLFVLVFFLGSAVGSFVNVLIDRTVAGVDWVAGRSHCDYCGKTLTWYDMVPMLSFLLYRGRSRCCGKPLSWRYPVVEAMVGLLFVWWLAMGSFFFRLAVAPLPLIQPSFWLLSGILLCILALADLFYGVVLMGIVALGYILTLLYRLTLLSFGSYRLHDFLLALALSALFFAFFWALYRLTRGRGMADGDMYAAAYIGLLLGWPKGLVALFLSFVIGAVVGIVLIATGLRKRHDSVPFVPFMVLGAMIALYSGEFLWRLVYPL